MKYYKSSPDYCISGACKEKSYRSHALWELALCEAVSEETSHDELFGIQPGIPSRIEVFVQIA